MLRILATSDTSQSKCGSALFPWRVGTIFSLLQGRTRQGQQKSSHHSAAISPAKNRSCEERCLETHRDGVCASRSLVELKLLPVQTMIITHMRGFVFQDPSTYCLGFSKVGGHQTSQRCAPVFRSKRQCDMPSAVLVGEDTLTSVFVNLS